MDVMPVFEIGKCQDTIPFTTPRVANAQRMMGAGALCNEIDIVRRIVARRKPPQRKSNGGKLAQAFGNMPTMSGSFK
jgi:hypothetical protein